MCAQCMIGATTAAVGVTGVRAWLATKRYAWLPPRGMRVLTAGLIALGLIGASLGFGAP